jgi:hypothetical protein
MMRLRTWGPQGSISQPAKEDQCAGEAQRLLEASAGSAGRFRRLVGLLVIGYLLALLLLPQPAGAQDGAPGTEAKIAASEPEFDLSDVLVTRTPLPSTSVELRYRYERDRERQEAGSAVTHVHQPSLNVSLAVTDWLQLSATLPYQIRDVRAPDTGSTETRNLGDVSAEFLVTFLKDSARQLAVAGGFDLGLPTGSIRDGTGGQWTLAPFLGAGKLLGPLQLMADVGFQDDFRAAPDGGKPKRELIYNLAVAYPLFETRFLPFVEVNGAYAFTGVPAIRHRGQLYLSPGVRISSVGWLSALAEHRPAASNERPNAPAEKPWWQRLSLAVGAQFPVTGAREFEWALTSALKLDL